MGGQNSAPKSHKEFRHEKEEHEGRRLISSLVRQVVNGRITAKVMHFNGISFLEREVGRLLARQLCASILLT